MRPIFPTISRFNKPGIITIAIFAALLFAAARAIGMLGPLSIRFLLPVGFILMALMPFIFLNKAGREKVGFVKSNPGGFYANAVLSGAALAFLCYSLGLVLFDHSADNWYVSIKNSYLRTMDTTGMAVGQMFTVFTIPALIFSPIGEEIFFRGFLQESLATRLNYNAAVIVDSLLFALVHLFHHGIVKDATGQLQFYPLSGAIWVALMFITALTFAQLKKRSGSIYPPILAHAVFNLVMNICIFYGKV